VSDCQTFTAEADKDSDLIQSSCTSDRWLYTPELMYDNTPHPKINSGYGRR